jgi:hypothetical protein
VNGSLPLAVGDSVWELLGIVVIVLVPTVPITYLAWNFISSRRTSPRSEAAEIESGRSAATPFAAISVVGTAIAIAAVLTLLFIVAVRAVSA